MPHTQAKCCEQEAQCCEKRKHQRQLPWKPISVFCFSHGSTYEYDIVGSRSLAADLDSGLIFFDGADGCARRRCAAGCGSRLPVAAPLLVAAPCLAMGYEVNPTRKGNTHAGSKECAHSVPDMLSVCTSEEKPSPQPVTVVSSAPRNLVFLKLLQMRKSLQPCALCPCFSSSRKATEKPSGQLLISPRPLLSFPLFSAS